MVASESPSGSFKCTALSLICCLVAFLTRRFTIVDSVEFPSAPQEYGFSDEHELHPLMPDPLPIFRDTGRRRALIVRDRRVENHTLILTGI